jgi:tetratricopeptide (TPR) repeat protein
MFLALANIGVMTLVMLVAWGLSWYDPKVMGVNDRNDLVRRGLRCGVTLLLAEAAIWSLWQFIFFENRADGEMYLALALALAFLWGGCVTALLSRAFQWLIKPGDDLDWEIDRSLRDLDRLARLVRNGHRKEAIQLCLKLKQSGDASVLALETILDHLGIPQPNHVRQPDPLVEASHLRQEGKFGKAEALLKSLLFKNPDNVDAAMMLIRLYAQDLCYPDKAQKVLQALEKRTHIPRGHTDFARHSIQEWSEGKPEPEPEPVTPESMEELLAHRHFGTAVEQLEQKIQDQPGDFDSWLKLAEVYAEHCDNLGRADAIVQQITGHSIFSREQIQTAKARLVTWREAEAKQSARE